MEPLRPAIENLGKEDLVEISRASLELEWGRRSREYSIAWWPGRRLSGIVRALLAGLVSPETRLVVGAALASPETIEVISSLARGRLVVDPFSGGGTIPFEAARLGFRSLGLDSNPYAIGVSRATSTLLRDACKLKVECLRRAAAKAWERAKSLWCGRGFCIVQVLLAKCPPCEAPVWVARRRGTDILLDGGLNLIQVPAGSKPVGVREPRTRLPEGLPEEAPGFRAYAAEIIMPGGSRRWVSLTPRDPLGGEVARHLVETLSEAVLEVSRIVGIPVPPGRETAKLLKSGIRDLKMIATPRQLYTLSLFAGAAGPECRLEAAVLTGSSLRTLSLMAFYHQPSGRANPGLVVKSFWIPNNPVEVNPLGSQCMPGPPEPGCKPIGRGGLAGYVARYASACAERHMGFRGHAVFERWDSLKGLPPGLEPYAIVTDPPYPGMQSYGELTLVYAVGWRLAGLSPERRWWEIDPMSSRYPELLGSSLSRVLERVVEGGYMVLLLSAGTPRNISLVARVISMLRGHATLARIYPLVGESPGFMGRSRNRLVYAIVFRKGPTASTTFMEPLYWAGEIVMQISPAAEARVAEDVSWTLASMLETLDSR